jgi:hypothetical protein
MIGRSGYLWEILTRPGPPEPIWYGADIVLTPEDLKAIFEERHRRQREFVRRREAEEKAAREWEREVEQAMRRLSGCRYYGPTSP